MPTPLGRMILRPADCWFGGSEPAPEPVPPAATLAAALEDGGPPVLTGGDPPAGPEPPGPGNLPFAWALAFASASTCAAFTLKREQKRRPDVVCTVQIG